MKEVSNDESNKISITGINTKQEETLLESYKSGLYLFGFIKVIRGRRWEKLFWAVSMFLIMSFTLYMVYKNTNRFIAYDVKTKVQDEKKAEKNLPVIIFCTGSTMTSLYKCKDSGCTTKMELK